MVLLFIAAHLPIVRAQAPADGTARAAAETGIRAAVLRYQMENWWLDGEQNERLAKTPDDKNAAKDKNFQVFFVSINGKDPDDEFLKRFSDIPRTIEKASAAWLNKKEDNNPRDRKMHEAGIIFSADEIHWIASDSVRVDGGYFCGTQCGAKITYSVQFQDGKWVVISIQTKWVAVS
jgi:hypothetical protein